MTDIERRILRVLQKGLPQSSSPYNDMADEIGIEVDELLRVLKEWKKEGKLRRIGAIVNHFKVGLDAAAMVIWQVGPGRVVEVGQIFATFKEVSHAYERKTYDNWPWNLYTMVHGRSEQEVQEVVKRMSEKSGVCDYRILATEKELKKVPPIYIVESE